MFVAACNVRAASNQLPLGIASSCGVLCCDGKLWEHCALAQPAQSVVVREAEALCVAQC